MRKKVSSSGDEGNNEYKKGLWTVEEDKILMDYVKAHGKGHWNRIAKKTGLFPLSLSNRIDTIYDFLSRMIFFYEWPTVKVLYIMLF